MKKIFIRALLFMPLAIFATGVFSQRKLSMQDAFDLASTGNRQLMVEIIGTQKAEETIKESKSYLLPSLSANASYNVFGERPVIYLRNELSDGSKVEAVKFGGRYAFDGNITAAYPLMSAPLRSEVRKAIIDSKIQEQKLNLTEEDLAWQVGNLYLDILLMQENKISLEHSLQRNEHALRDSRSLFSQGKNLKTDTLSNYISVQNLKAALLKAENEISFNKKYLKHVLGLDDSAEIVLTERLASETNPLLVTSSGISDAEENRKDVRMQKLLIDRNVEELEGLRSSFRPQITALAQYQLQNQSDNPGRGGYSFPRTSFVGVRASIPIYSGKRLRYKASQFGLIQQQREIQLAEIKSRIKTEVESVYADLVSAYNDHDIRKENVNAALINYTMMRDRYRAGLGTRLEVTDAEVALTRSKLDLVKSAHLIKVKQLQLQKTTGTLKLKRN